MNEQLDGKMRETLSALMDDEASELELHRVMRETSADEMLHDTWSRYHLVASAMRKELPVDFVDSSAQLRAAINMALVSEPVPKRSGQWPQALGRVAIAASVAVLAIFGAQQYQVFEPSVAMPHIALNSSQGSVQSMPAKAKEAGPQFQLPSGFEVPQATARTASTGSYNIPRPSQIANQPSVHRVETDKQINAYMQRLMSQRGERNFRHASPVFLPAQHGMQQDFEK
ncbi:hypothetical protein A9Q89_07615 [Gammaproteobacteria bacterium 53_120_T64]|nr:hypothetical protein A9Q89_07615 [Gammaproteobacteria bacterium 53_120_T64]